jgi:hypothetical protein
MTGVLRQPIKSGAHDGFESRVTVKTEETYFKENVSEGSKERMMMKKIWGLMIILCCCFVSVAFGEETNFTLAAPGQPVLVQTRVDVSIENNGQLTLQAHGTRLKGKVTVQLQEKVTLLSGDYAGWGYAYSEYKVGNLKGAIYFVFHHNEWQGMVSGDVVGVAQQSNSLEGDMTWRVAKVGRASTQTTVNLAFDSYNPGKQAIIQDVWMPVLPNFTLSTAFDSTGQYIGSYEQETTVLLLPAPDGNLHRARKFKGGGLEFGTYEAGMNSGTIWSFIDNTEIADPFNKKRFGTRDGALAGTSEIFFNKDAEGNTKIKGTAIHVAPY